MLKEFAKYLEQRPAPVIIEHGGRKYSDKELFKVSNSTPDNIKVTTLQAVADFINKGVDEGTSYPPGRVIVHIQSPTEVVLTSECGLDGSRCERVLAAAVVPTVPFGRFMDTETFNITLQSMFVDTDTRAAVLSVVGNITDGAVSGFEDDGVTQKVTIKAGIQRVGTAEVPNPVVLAPYRTFPEVEQPASPFVLRMKPGAGDAPSAALFEADGTAWRLEAMQNIRAYFEAALPADKLESGNIVIIA